MDNSEEDKGKEQNPPQPRVRFSSVSAQLIPQLPDYEESAEEDSPKTASSIPNNSQSPPDEDVLTQTQHDSRHRVSTSSPIHTYEESAALNSTSHTGNFDPHSDVNTSTNQGTPGTVSLPEQELPPPVISPVPRRGILKNSIASPGHSIMQPLTQAEPESHADPIVNRFLRHVDSTIVAKKRKEKSNHNNKPE